MKLEVDTSNVGGWIKRHSGLVLITGFFALSWFAVKQVDEEAITKLWWGLICVGALIGCVGSVCNYFGIK